MYQSSSGSHAAISVDCVEQARAERRAPSSRQIGYPGRGLWLCRWLVLDGHETERFAPDVLEVVEQVFTGGEVEVPRVAGPA